MYTSDKDSETCGAELHDDVCVSDHLDIGGLAAILFCTGTVSVIL